jgi:hypothetical protein
MFEGQGMGGILTAVLMVYFRAPLSVFLSHHNLGDAISSFLFLVKIHHLLSWRPPRCLRWIQHRLVS